MIVLENKNDIFGKRLKELRKNRGMSQDDVGKEIGVSRARYSHYENNHVEPDIGLIRKLADLYNVKVDYLMGRSDSPDMTEEESFGTFIKDPSLRRWHKDLPKSEEEDLRRLRKIWEAFRDDER